MNAQGQQFFDTREFRIGVLGVFAVIVLVVAAYLFGTGLRADTPASVAPSPLGSSLTAIRESHLDDYYGRLRSSSAAAVAASPAENRSEDYFFRMNRSSAVVRSTSPAESRLEDYYFRMTR